MAAETGWICMVTGGWVSMVMGGWILMETTGWICVVISKNEITESKITNEKEEIAEDLPF